MSEDLIVIIPGSDLPGSLPVFVEPENFDLWPSASVTKQAIDTVHQIVDLGYKGVKILSALGTDGRIFTTYFTNKLSPEGRLARGLLELARVGKGIPTNEAITILESVYRLDDLPPPQITKPRA